MMRQALSTEPALPGLMWLAPAGVSGDEGGHPDRDEQSGQFNAELGDITGRRLGREPPCSFLVQAGEVGGVGEQYSRPHHKRRRWPRPGSRRTPGSQHAGSHRRPRGLSDPRPSPHATALRTCARRHRSSSPVGVLPVRGGVPPAQPTAPGRRLPGQPGHRSRERRRAGKAYLGRLEGTAYFEESELLSPAGTGERATPCW